MIPPPQFIGGQWLSHRHGQVLLCCSYCMTMKQTADKLFISERTVGGHHQEVRQLYSVKGYHGLLILGLQLQEDLEKWHGTGLRPD